MQNEFLSKAFYVTCSRSAFDARLAAIMVESDRNSRDSNMTVETEPGNSIILLRHIQIASVCEASGDHYMQHGH